MKILAVVAIALVVTLMGVGVATSDDVLFADAPTVTGYGPVGGGEAHFCTAGEAGCNSGGN